MREVYFLFLMVMVSIGSSYITTQLPMLKAWFKRVFTRTKRESLNVSCAEMESRITALETKINKRESNQRTFIRSEVKDYLEKLAK